MSSKNYQPLKIWELLKISWSKVKGTKSSIWVALLIYVGLNIFFRVLEIFGDSIILSGVYEFAAFILLDILIFTGIVYIGIRRAFALPISYRNMFITFRPKVAANLIILSILTELIPLLLFVMLCLFSLLLAVIFFFPLIYFCCRLSMAPLLVIHKDLNFIQALHESMLLTRWNIIKLILCFGCVMIFVFFGYLSLGIGMIWLAPLSIIFCGEIYKSLLESAEKQLTAKYGNEPQSEPILELH